LERARAMVLRPVRQKAQPEHLLIAKTVHKKTMRMEIKDPPRTRNSEKGIGKVQIDPSLLNQIERKDGVDPAQEPVANARDPP